MIEVSSLSPGTDLKRSKPEPSKRNEPLSFMRAVLIFTCTGDIITAGLFSYFYAQMIRYIHA